MKVKKTPQRMCIACKTTLPKSQLIRIVRNSQGQFFVDKNERLEGRGCYICGPACWDKCIKLRLLNKAYKIDIGSEVYEKLNAEFDTKKD